MYNVQYNCYKNIQLRKDVYGVLVGITSSANVLTIVQYMYM